MNDNDYALIIGVNDYTPTPAEGGLRRLRGAVPDATEFNNWILSSTGGNIPPGNCKTITSTNNPDKPLQDHIDEEFVNIQSLVEGKNGEARRLYFYFSGHGFGINSSTKEIALCLVRWSSKFRHNAISSEKYKDRFVQFGFFDEIFVIADCCRNFMLNVIPKEPTFGPAISKSKSTKLFTAYSTQYQDSSYEVEQAGSEETRGVFTKVLLDGLKGGAVIEGGIITAQSLKTYLQKNTIAEAQKINLKQSPYIEHSFDDEPIFMVPDFESFKQKCRIEFVTQRSGNVELINGDLLLEATFNPIGHSSVYLELKPGLFVLKDVDSGDQKFFSITKVNNDATFIIQF